MNLSNTVSLIDTNILDLTDAMLIEILLDGKENLDDMNTINILDSAIKFLIEIKRPDAQIF